MSAISQAFYDVLSADDSLAALLATYGGSPAVFTMDPAPGDAVKPYIVTAGEVATAARDYTDKMEKLSAAAKRRM